MAGEEDNTKATVARLEEDVHAYTEWFTVFEGALDKCLKSIEDSNETFTRTLAAIWNVLMPMMPDWAPPPPPLHDI
jgi:hypothetical protein